MLTSYVLFILIVKETSMQGAINCPYYMKTGACKYGATCKFDHPPPGEVMAAAMATASVVGEGKQNGDV